MVACLTLFPAPPSESLHQAPVDSFVCALVLRRTFFLCAAKLWTTGWRVFGFDNFLRVFHHGFRWDVLGLAPVGSILCTDASSFTFLRVFRHCPAVADSALVGMFAAFAALSRTQQFGYFLFGQLLDSASPTQW